MLRPYQQQAKSEVIQHIRAGRRRVILVIPTGGGKTVTAADIILGCVRKGNRAIFLAHTTELIDQCSKTLDVLGVDHGVIQGKGHPQANLAKLVQVASIQTLIRRSHWPADLIIIDEGHRSLAKTYRDIYARYDEKTVLLSLTATPYRQDGKPLGEMYNAMVEVVSAQELVDDGFLINPTVFGAKHVDISEVKTTGGDYNARQVSKVMQPKILRGELLSNWAEICGKATGAETVWRTVDRSDGPNREVVFTNCDACTVIFAPTIADSEAIAQQFSNAGVKAAHVDGNTPSKERARILNDLCERRIDVVSNVSLLTEGWDLPRLECIVGARPTRSKALYKQMGGRLMRPDDDKRFAYLIDHANWTRTHGFLTEPTIHTLTEPEKRPRKSDLEKLPPLKECPQCGAVHPIGATECMECYYEWPKKELEFTNEDLVELDPSQVQRAQFVPQEERQRVFDQLATACIEKGHKPNWARVRYSNIYGEWPTQASGIRVPRFFKQYERELNRRLKRQATAQAAAKAISS